MNQQTCSEKSHLSYVIGKCTFIRCSHEICQACKEDHLQHQNFILMFQNLGQMKNNNEQQILLNKLNALSTLSQINQALKNFDEQFDKKLKELIEVLQIEKINMRIQFEQFLRDDLPNLQKFTQGSIQPIQQLFDCIYDSLKMQYGAQVNIDFTTYLDKFGIPDFMREQLNKFQFDSNEFENVKFETLYEEQREKSLIVGQKDENNQFNGRALIVYKTDPAAIYLGYLKNNKRHGKGILVLNAFQYYMGGFYDNKEWGYGEIQFINKDKQNEKFVGYFSEGKRCGSGQSFILDTATKQEISNVFVNYLNETLHGPRVVQAVPSSKYNFELFQNEKNYFSFKNKYIDKALLSKIFVQTKGMTEGQALNKYPKLQIDKTFKEYKQPDQKLLNDIINPYQSPKQQILGNPYSHLQLSIYKSELKQAILKLMNKK
ncbi:hypothetical protein ABPG72_008223 [Tetrahymena utriculariae]